MKISKLYFIVIGEEGPRYLNLGQLPNPGIVCSQVSSMFGAFYSDQPESLDWDSLANMSIEDAQNNIVYLYGHAWLNEDRAETSIKLNNSNRIISANDLIQSIFKIFSPSKTLLFFDCCHAEAFDYELQELGLDIALAVYSCSINEKSISLTSDNSSRFIQALSRELHKSNKPVDLLDIIIKVRQRLNKNGVVHGQSVKYRHHGRELELIQQKDEGNRARERAQNIIRTRLLTSGVIVTCLFILIAWYIHQHSLIEVNMSNVGDIAATGAMIAFEEDPSNNMRLQFAQKNIKGNVLRFWVPSRNITVNFEFNFTDGKARELNYHFQIDPSFDVKRKLISINLPNKEDVLSSAGMAYIPPSSWLQGEQNTLARSNKGFWIDIAPPTFEAYESIALQLNRKQLLLVENSITLFNRAQAWGEELYYGDLDWDTLEKIGIDIQTDVADIVTDTITVCSGCPALMTLFEAHLYCRYRGMRLPTPKEWELSVRGTDGRRYPWGNKIDKGKANIPGLPDKVGVPSTLKSIEEYSNNKTPFGLIDTVGNAGDWVSGTDNFGGIYMGATYTMNPDDSVVWMLLPQPRGDFPFVREITARCVKD